MNRLLNVIALIATITVNALANALPINGQRTGEVSDRFDVYFTPAGYVFSIWSVIYLGLLAFCIFQFMPTQRRNSNIDHISPAFWLSCVANISWILLWHYEYFGATLAVMLVLLGALIWISRTSFAALASATSGEKLFLHAPFSLYLGWITVATIANLTVVLEVTQLRPFDVTAEQWAVAMVILGGLLAICVGLIRRDLIYMAVVIWAFMGIAVAQNWSGAVGISAVAFSVLIAVQGSYLWMRRRLA